MNNRRGVRGNFVVGALIALVPASFGIAAATDAVLAAARPSQAALDTCFSGQGGEPRIVACSIVIGSSHSDIELEKALNHRGLDYQAQGEHEKAVEDFTQLIKMAPGVAAYRDSRQASYRALGNLAAALVDANSAVILADDSAYVYHSRATVLFAMKQYSDALQGYDRAIKLDPQPAFRYLDKATDLRRLSRNGDAIATLTQGLALNPMTKSC